MSANLTTPPEAASSANNNRVALGYILIAVVSYALVPAAIEYIGGKELPFFFVAAWRLGVAVSCVGVLIVFYLPLWLNKYNWGRFKYYLSTSETKAVDWRFPAINLHIVVDELRIPLVNWKIPGDFIDWRILLTILGNCEYALFAWSLQYIDVTISTIVFQSWPIFFLILSALLLRENIRHFHNGKTALSLFLLISLGFIGFAFIVFSQTGEIGELGDVSLFHLIIGIALAASAMALGNLKAFGIDWGRRLGNQLSGSITGLGSSPAMFFVLVSFLISSFGAAVVGLIVGLGRGETWDTDLLGMAFIGGMVINATAGIMWRKANMADDDIGFNALGYAIPVVAILFLLLFGDRDLKVDYLILGVTAIVVANLLINFEAEVRWSFEALILALGGCGTIVYFREDLLDWAGVPNWTWSGDGYFGSVAMAATVFTLLLAFRVARLVTRTSDEENRTFNLLRKLDSLARRNVIDGDALECIRIIDESNKQATLREYYIKVRSYIRDATPANDSDRDALNQTEADLDTLVRSKQATPVLGEIFALLVFAGITIFLTMFTKPSEPDGFIRMLVDLFAMLVSSVIIFLMIYSMDLDRERDAHKLERTTKEEEYLLVFPDTEQRLFDQWLSIIVGIGIILVYTGLIANKWLGWFSG